MKQKPLETVARESIAGIHSILRALPANTATITHERLADIADNLRAALPPEPLSAREIETAAELIQRAAANGQLAIGEGDIEDDWTTTEASRDTVALCGDPTEPRLEIIQPVKP